MTGPITIEQVQQEYEEHPYATPLEHVYNIVEGNSSSSESETESEEE